jgi:hypothetical protein
MAFLKHVAAVCLTAAGLSGCQEGSTRGASSSGSLHTLEQASAQPSCGAPRQGGPPGREFIGEYYRKYSKAVDPKTPPEALAPILDAMRDRRFAEALAACDELIRRDENRFRSRPEASWLKAEAHYYRGAALYELTGDNREAARELKRATVAPTPGRSRVRLDGRGSGGIPEDPPDRRGARRQALGPDPW